MIFNIPVGGKAKVSISAYGAASETVTLTNAKGKSFSLTANNGSKLEIPVGNYTVYGNKSGFKKTVIVDKTTTRIDAWPDGAKIYYWYGYAPLGSPWAVWALPTNSPWDDDPTGVEITPSTNSFYAKTYGDYARGGSVFFPKTQITGKTMTLVCSGAKNSSYLMLNLAPTTSNYYTLAASANIATGATTVNMNISSVSGKSYYPAISMNTSGYDTGSQKSYITVKALYSV